MRIAKYPKELVHVERMVFSVADGLVGFVRLFLNLSKNVLLVRTCVTSHWSRGIFYVLCLNISFISSLDIYREFDTQATFIRK